MPIRRLDTGTQERLGKTPETGMGYHFVRGRESWADEADFIVLGSTFALPVDAWLPELLDQDRGASIDALAADAASMSLTLAAPLAPAEARAALAAKLASVIGTAPSLPPPGTTLTLKTTSNGDDAFLRYYYTRSDPRISAAGVVASGTYATTFRDGVIVTSGFSAVARYALPVPLAAEFVHVLTPPKGVKVEIGAAVPFFGQAGGGVEAFFPNSFAMTLRPFSIPPY